MQNREIPADDEKGLAEPLLERDEFGNGIRVRATYYLQIGSKADSKARLVQ